MRCVFELPLRIESEANRQEHWSRKQPRKKMQGSLVPLALRLAPKFEGVLKHFNAGGKTRITFIRIAPRKLDDDNLPNAFKKCRDSVADLMKPGLAPGRADDDPRFEWKYDQSPRGSEYAMRVELETIANATVGSAPLESLW